MVATRRKNYSPEEEKSTAPAPPGPPGGPAKEESGSSPPGFKLTAVELSQLHQSRDVSLLYKEGGVAGVAKAICTDLKTGVNGEEAKTFFAKRRGIYGSNTVPAPPIEGLLSLIWEGLQDKTLIMLIVAAVVSLILGLWEKPSTGWIEGTAILAAVALVLLVASTNDYHKERQFRALNDKKNNKLVKVTRGGEQLQVSVHGISKDINVGDIVPIDIGDILCADGILISSEGLVCDESALTGESEGIKKSAEAPFLLSGSQVVDGTGQMLVVCVGPNSESGRTLALLQWASSFDDFQK